RAGESEETFFQYGVLSVPQRQSEAKTTLAIRDAEQSILAPAIGPASRLIMRKIAPGISLFGIVFAHCCPLAFRQIWSPTFPILLSGFVFVQTLRFFVHADRMIA